MYNRDEHGLTPRNREILDFYYYAWCEGYIPPMREVGDAFGIQVNAVANNVRRLAQTGHIIKRPNGATQLNLDKILEDYGW